MPARCIAHPPHQASRSWILHEGAAEHVLGRGEGVDLLVDDDRISRRHARFVFDGAWRIEDLESKNGIVVDGRPTERSTLSAAHWIDVGGVLLRFEVLDPETAMRLAGEDLSRWRSSHALERELTPELAPEEILGRLLGSALRLSGLERGFVLSRGAPGGSPEAGLEVAAREELSRGDLSSPRFRGSVSAVNRVLEERRPVATTDASLDTWLGERASILTGGIRGLVCLPLEVDGHLQGALYVDSRRPGAAVTELDVEILSALADHAALVLSLSEARRRLEMLERAASGVAGEPDLARTATGWSWPAVTGAGETVA